MAHRRAQSQHERDTPGLKTGHARKPIRQPAALVYLAMAGFMGMLPPIALADSPPTTNLSEAIVPPARLPDWQPIFQGVALLQVTATRPRPLRLHVARIDSQAAGIDFLVTPANGKAPKDVGARSTSEFLAEFHCQVAINGSVFDTFAEHRGDPMDVLGLSLSRGHRYSKPNHWDALLIGADRRAWIARSPVDSRKAWNGLSGYHALLTGGVNRGDTTARHPRTAVGVSREGRYLYLLVADGRQPGYSEGLSTAETAAWLKRLGAHDGLNLDGGGSTTLVIAGAGQLPVIVNRPSGPPPGSERRVANHLCVYARRLPENSGAQSSQP